MLLPGMLMMMMMVVQKRRKGSKRGEGKEEWSTAKEINNGKNSIDKKNNAINKAAKEQV